MTIRPSMPGDLPTILQIYAEARDFMRRNGNPTQWKDWYPPQTMIENDLSPDGHGYVCEEDGKILAAFYFTIERDLTYDYIEGQWLDDKPYGVIHRIAVKRGSKGVGAFCLNWAFAQCHNLKIDTHTDNAPMRTLLGKLGFFHCGTIWVLNGTEERMAFQKN